MMKHVVTFRRLRGVAPDASLELELTTRMRGIDGHIDFVREWKFNANELDRPICWDYLLESSFDDAQAVARYIEHPAHQALIADLKKYFEWVAVDYTI